tara:strand:+ start:11524 stop:11826 length:303 start_codon:yes stop_codon:yes gene_type:complete
VQDDTCLEITDDEFIGILLWIKYFNYHYKEHGKEKYPDIKSPVISKRIHIDFGLYNIPSDVESNRGKYIIYICNNDNRIYDEKTKIKKYSVKEVIDTWYL